MSPSPSRPPSPAKRIAAGVAGIVTLAVVFVVDLLTPLGYLDGILYAVPVLMGLWVPGGRYAVMTASAATLFILIDLAVSGRAAVPLAVVFVDRLSAVAILWALAGAISWRKKRDAAIERLSAIVESSEEAIIGTALDGTVTSFNAGAERLFGVGAADVVGRRLGSLVPTAVRDFKGLLTKIAAGETLDRFEIRLPRPDGSEIWLSLRISPVREGDGRITGASAIAHNISRRKAAEERLALVLKSAPVLLLRLDADGRITFAEGQPLGALGTDASGAAGRQVVSLFGSEEWAVDETRRVLSGEAFTGGGKAGGRWWENHYVPLRGHGGSVTGAVAVSIDVTDRKEAEEKLVLQEALARLGTMAAVVAHEVKNPLAGIGGAIQVLRDRLSASASDREILSEILERLKGLNALVQDLLEFARPREPRFTRLPLRALLRETAALLASDPSCTGLEIPVEGPDVTLMADADFLRDVFHNLLLNGAQATGGKGPLALTIVPDRERCRVMVRDGGPGVPPGLGEKVFEPFFTTKHRGTGLGLSIARRLVEAHGGTLTLETAARGGTNAIVELPLSRP